MSDDSKATASPHSTRKSGVDMEQRRTFGELTTAAFRILAFNQRVGPIPRQRIMPHSKPNASRKRRYQRPQAESRTVRDGKARCRETRESYRDAGIRLTAQLECRGVHAAVRIDVFRRKPAVQVIAVGDRFEVSQAVRPSRYRDK